MGIPENYGYHTDNGSGTPKKDYSTNPMAFVGPQPPQKKSKKPKNVAINEYVGEVLTNELDDFDNATYNLKLYMIAPGTATTSASNPSTIVEDSESGGQTQSSGTGWVNDAVRDKPENTVVLAQTGVTEVGIDNVSIFTVPGGDGSKQSACNFTIRQPNAADFPDQIVRARTYLGMAPDAMDCPLFLEINFVGYKESDMNQYTWNTDEGGQPQLIKGPYIFPLILKNFSMNIDLSGSQYDFETVVKDDIPYADKFFRIPRLITITGDSIYEMLADLEEQVNNLNEKNKKIERISFGLPAPSGTTDAESDTVTLSAENFQGGSLTKTVPGLLLNDQSLDIQNAENVAKVINPKTNEAKDTEEADAETKTKRLTSINIDKDADDNKISIDLKAQMTLEEVLGILLSMNKEFMEKSNRSKLDPTNTEVDINKKVMWYRFNTSVQYSDFDKKRKEYTKTAYFIPETYLSPRSDIAAMPEEVIKTAEITKEEARQRVNQMHVRKAYDYIFTGRNDQILDVNIQYNEGIALLLPTERGLLGDVSLNASSVLNSNSVPKNESAKDGGIDKLNESAKKDGVGFFDALKELKDTAESTLNLIGQAANFNTEQMKDLIDNQAGAAAQKLKNILSDQVSAQAIADSLTPGRTAQAQSNVTTEVDEFSPKESGFIYGGDLGLQGQQKFAEKLKDGGLLFKDQHSKDDGDDDPDKGATQKGIALRYQENYKSGFAKVGTTKGIKNNLFTYLYDQHQAVDFLMTLEMSLRGDPWWLGKEPLPAGIDKIPAGQPASNTKEVDTDTDNYLTTTRDNFFLFSLNSPRLFDANVENEDANTGLWDQKNDGTSYFLSGIYQVKQVTHTFDNGEYKMDIVGIKETAINLDHVGRLSNFSFVDTERTVFTSRSQDGNLTESDREAAGGKWTKDPYYQVKGAMANTGDSPEKLLKDGKISQEQYDGYISQKKENDNG